MALGDGIARNQGNKGFAYQKGYRKGLDDLLKAVDKEFGTGDEVMIEHYDLKQLVNTLKSRLD